MADLSIIIPYYHEPFLDRTIDSIKENSILDTEILPMEGSLGMRDAVNEGLAKATGRFIMKCDAHCIFAPGFDKELVDSCQDNWVMIPRRYSINTTDWTRSIEGYIFDYHYLAYPSLQIGNWPNRKSDLEIDFTMSYQGSCWFVNKDYFMKHIGYLDNRKETYGSFVAEQLEVGLKYWLGGGEVKVNKKTWYAHLHKNHQSYKDGKFNRDYKQGSQWKKNWRWATDHWLNDREPDMIHKLSWLVEKFAPVPTWE